MIKIDQAQIKKLKDVGLLREKTDSQEPNYTVANKEHPSRAKTYYLTEEIPQMRFLGFFCDNKVFKINSEQLNKILQKYPNIEIQTMNQYNPKAKIYNYDAQNVYAVKEPEILKILNNWSNK